MSSDPSPGQVPRLDPGYAAALQAAVTEKLAVQTCEVVLRSAAESGDDNGDAVAAMLALLGLPEERRRRIMLHPTFRFWPQGMRRASRAELDAVRRGVHLGGAGAARTDVTWLAAVD